jgi:hypothetical protein
MKFTYGTLETRATIKTNLFMTVAAINISRHAGYSQFTAGIGAFFR